MLIRGEELNSGQYLNNPLFQLLHLLVFVINSNPFSINNFRGPQAALLFFFLIVVKLCIQISFLKFKQDI